MDDDYDNPLRALRNRRPRGNQNLQQNWRNHPAQNQAVQNQAVPQGRNPHRRNENQPNTNNFRPPNVRNVYQNGNQAAGDGTNGIYRLPNRRNGYQNINQAIANGNNGNYMIPRRRNDHQNRNHASVNGNNDNYRPATERNRYQERNLTSADGQQRWRRLGFKKLEEWCTKEPDILIIEMIGQKTGFEDLLVSELSGDYIVLVLRVLAKMCSSLFSANKTVIMNMASEEKFISNLMNYVMLLQLQDRRERNLNTYFWKDIEGFFGNLIVVFESLIDTIPTRACEVLPKMTKAVTLAIRTLEQEQNVQISDDTKEKFKNVQGKLDLCKAEMEKKKKQPICDEEIEEPPPDDFRQLSVYPTSEEILDSSPVYVRKHVIQGAYTDVDHYLDVQFRLLKEDFVAPLREGVRKYLTDDHSKKIANVRIHKHVEFLSPRFGKDQAGVLLQFDFSTAKQRNYKYSKRFMYGSLVCFTKDSFMTLMFGKIIERDMKLLEQGQIVIGFERGLDNYELNQPYIMIECSVYFEPYYHVLKALQNMHEEGFPMKNYLIDVNPSVEPPSYLNPRTVYEIQNYAVPLSAPNSWPSAENLGLDKTQYDAFKAALTQKFAVIQGPPGTGKTYLGLEVAKTLINNGRRWYNRTPILVVCFTNHALDQFLEGLIGTTENIVRVGGQSKNEKLAKFNLREKRKSGNVNRNVNRALYHLRDEIREQLTKIKAWSDGLDEIYKYQSIVHFRHFRNIDPEFQNTWFASASDKAIVDWLFGGQTDQDRRREELKIRLEEMQKQIEQQPQDGDDVERKLDMEMDKLWEAENRAEHEIDDFDDTLDLVNLRGGSDKPTFLTSVSQITELIHQITMELAKLGDDISEQAVYNKKWELEGQLYEADHNLEYLRFRLNEGKNLKIARKPNNLDVRHPHNMTPNNRWRLYFYWLYLYQTSLINQLIAVQAEYRNKNKQYMEIKDIEDTELMKQMLVVGMTTTGAARLQTTLQALQSRIVIVEEAAEVLESHIIVSLTNNCEHLILIGDHQQLRPSTADYRMEHHFNLGISLFERMVRNNIQCHVLGVQHRMRPEIAKLIVPSIYPVLENHPSVCNFPPVLGIDPYLYFINHDYPEQESGDASKLNIHEAQFLIRLARYLIQNGYEPEDITILAAYSGQMFALWKERKVYDFLLKDVRITVLDNYQGEESKIILLSLVRNNNNNSIGFLKIENRVCVALSRAKEGFYMMGNMDLLCRSSQIWPKIRTSLESQEFLGNSLALRCQIHREEVTRVKMANDFKNVPEGGCSKLCGMELNCGHICRKMCHITDRAHETTKCLAQCPKILCENNHQCPKKCFEECGPCQVPMKQTLPCSHEHVVPCWMDPKEYKCQTPVTVVLPCEHTVTNKPCCQNTETYKCPFRCDTRLECGHACAFSCHVRNDPDHLNYKCYKPCSKPRLDCSTGTHVCPKSCFEECPPCMVVVKKSNSICPHIFDVACNVDVKDVDCPKPCTKKLPCGHKCKKKCYEPCENCQEKILKVLPECSHRIKTKCCEEPNRKYCKGQCPFKLPCGHPCKNKCNEPCTAECKELVDHRKPADCGHKFKIECRLLNEELPSNSRKLLKFCQEPCTVTLDCNHRCSGTCGKCAQGRIHQTCQHKCGVRLICGHECTIPCRETCQPCTRNCSYRCAHSACKKKCGEPCTNCKERCTRRCNHVQCKAKCGDFCTVPPCTEPCAEKLPCGHLCVGFCGDPCPPLCRECDKEELTEIIFGDEDEPDARFVFLKECKHVIESGALDKWLGQDDKEINYKSCPKCTTPLSSTQRYSDYIKRAINDVIEVKKKYYGNTKANEEKRQDLREKLDILEIRCQILFRYSPLMEKLLEDWKLALNPVRGNRRQPLNTLLAQTYTAKIEIIKTMVEIFKGGKFRQSYIIPKTIEHIDFVVKRLLQQEQRITKQEIADFQRELRRYERIIQLCQIEDCDKLQPVIASNPSAKELHKEVNKLIFSIEVYTDDFDANVKNKLISLSKAVEAGIGITDKERKEIVAAMGMGSGHWYKCPNGHVYAIGECGGAMQVSRCNECGAQIGGQSHRLVSGNQHAGEMDGSRHAAWSETANNMFNFEEFRNQLF